MLYRQLLRLNVQPVLYYCLPRCMVHEFYRKGDAKYEELLKKNDDKSMLWHVKNGTRILKREIKLWKEEVKENLHMDPKLYTPGDTEMVYKFNKKEDLDKWVVTSDQSNADGFSECSLQLTKYNHGLFSGFLNKRLPKDGRVVRTGYCNINLKAPRKAFVREPCFNWDPFTHLVLRIRGDGRTYGLILQTGGTFDINWQDIYTFVLFTRGGPYWQEAKIPFSRFFLVSKGRIQDAQGPVLLDRIKGLGISCADRAEGHFHLEIDYIGLYWDPNHAEEFAYEMYQLPKFYLD